MAKRLIVNADDYGHTPGTSAGIRQAHLQGIVSSTTAMMNRPDAESALVEALEECPRLGLGVHLVLTAGKPLLPADRIPGLVDEHGKFKNLDSLVSGLESLDLAQVEAEWTAQIEKFTAITGRAPDHLDAHHHVAYFTRGLFNLLTRFANRLGCAIRKPCSGTPEEAELYLPLTLQSLVFPGYLNLSEGNSPNTTDRFIGDFYADGATVEHLLNILDGIGNSGETNSFELMCHPAMPDLELQGISDYNTKRFSELEILTSNTVKEVIKSSIIKLVTFRDLSEEEPLEIS